MEIVIYQLPGTATVRAQCVAWPTDTIRKVSIHVPTESHLEDTFLGSIPGRRITECETRGDVCRLHVTGG